MAVTTSCQPVTGKGNHRETQLVFESFSQVSCPKLSSTLDNVVG